MLYLFEKTTLAKTAQIKTTERPLSDPTAMVIIQLLRHLSANQIALQTKLYKLI
jgi:hypothetical protein